MREIRRRGKRYVLGQVEQTFSVWTSASGDLVQSWPETREGWQAALQEFKRLEGLTREQASGSDLGTAALACGILGLMFGLTIILTVVALSFGLLAIVFGVMGLRKPREDRARLGIALGIAAVVLGTTPVWS